ncbi:hypothetical protein [Nakamurella sp. PAMC28650]|uniref:hypothetical protein n=1 Tax=Nakamurella sp. PAMC28650 TaxID=2762325 RepID=UPI00164E56C8|nr:hypothetical protein [Nakamurella sp. PAMC28650]QNK79474.1 hypothetical protein H7F38_14320 [Nakamurella sp. PAMC28650]
MRVFRLEFLQPPSMRTRWLGPYSAKWLTAEGEELATYLEAEHIRTRPHPVNTPLLKASTFENHHLCGCDSRTALSDWFGKYFGPLREQGGQVGVYEVPDLAVAEHLNGQVVFHHGSSRIIERDGHPAAAPLVLTSAGSRRAKIAAAAGKYDHWSPASQG